MDRRFRLLRSSATSTTLGLESENLPALWVGNLQDGGEVPSGAVLPFPAVGEGALFDGLILDFL